MIRILEDIFDKSLFFSLYKMGFRWVLLEEYLKIMGIKFKFLIEFVFKEVLMNVLYYLGREIMVILFFIIGYKVFLGLFFLLMVFNNLYFLFIGD